MEPSGFLTVMAVILVLNFGLNQVLDWLNFQSWKDKLPESLTDYYNETEYEKAKAYNKAKAQLGFLSETFNFLLLLFFLIAGGFGWLNGFLTPHFSSPVVLSLVYFGILFLASDILNLGFSLYSNFVIEERFGFNKMTVSLFIQDQLKSLAITILIGGLIMGSLLWLILNVGPYFWIYAFVLITSFTIVMNLFYADWILPLFNKLTPMEEGALKSRIKELAESLDFPITEIYVMDGSKRSNKANAFFSGMGKQKKIVLFDTLIEDHSEDELIAILAHEMGHFKRKHIPKNLGLSIFQIALMFFILSLIVYNENLSMALGANEWYLHLNLLAFGILYEPVSVLLGLFMNVVSRKFEYEADAFAARWSNKDALIAGLKKLATKHLSHLAPHPAYVFVHYSHPPVPQRIEALKQD